jgi:outer membrane receptor protein involved in Fe transport
MEDQIGTELNGDHRFVRFNPGVGASYALTDAVTLYGGYSESNRAPTPAELSCADPAAPCSLTNFFVGDPPLKQVVARTFEAGLRGNFTGANGADVKWRVGAFRTTSQDDIIYIASPVIGRGYFQNIGSTRRQGFEAGVKVEKGPWDAFVDYAFTDATFLTPLSITSSRNPFADGDGEIQVQPGDHLPGVAAHSVSFGIGYDVTDRWHIGFNGKAASGQYLFGDESNQNPKTNPYVVFGLDTSYKVTENFQVFGAIENLFNTKYETFGTFSETEEVPLVQVPGAENPRALSLGAPFAIYGGVKVKF